MKSILRIFMYVLLGAVFTQSAFSENVVIDFGSNENLNIDFPNQYTTTNTVAKGDIWVKNCYPNYDCSSFQSWQTSGLRVISLSYNGHSQVAAAKQDTLDFVCGQLTGGSYSSHTETTSDTYTTYGSYYFYQDRLYSIDSSSGRNTNTYLNTITCSDVRELTINFYDITNDLNISYPFTSTNLVNLSYKLNGGSSVSVCNNCLNGNINFNAPNVEGAHSIEFVLVDDNGETSTTKNFVIDTTKPVSNVINNYESTSFFVNWNDVFNYSDDNFNSCAVYYGDLILNCNNYTFTSAGIKNLSFKIVDKAGNSETKTFNLSINPYINFQFNDEIRQYLVSNYSFNIFVSNSTNLSIKLFDLNNGNNILEFVKPGYNKKTISFNLDYTNLTLNHVFQVKPVQFKLDLFDVSTQSPLVNWDIYVFDENSFLLFNKTISNTFVEFRNENLTGSMKIVLSKSGYRDTEFYVDFTKYSSVEKDVYLSKDTSFFMPITVQNTAQTKYLSGVLVSLFMIDNGIRFHMGDTFTDLQGKTYVPLNAELKYEVTLSKENFVLVETTISPYENSYLFQLTEERTELLYQYQGFSFKYNDQYDFDDYKYFSFDYFDELNKINSVKLKIEYFDEVDNITVIDELISINNQNDKLFFNISNNVLAKQYFLTAIVVRDGKTEEFPKTYIDTELVMSETIDYSLKKVLDEDLTFKIFFILVVCVIAAVSGVFLAGEIGSILFTIIALTVLFSMGILHGAIAVPLVLGLGFSLRGKF